MARMLSLLILVTGFLPRATRGDEPPAYDRKEDVIYARKFGSSLTMDIFTPRANANGAGHLDRQLRLDIDARFHRHGLPR